MTTLVACLSTGKGTWGHVTRLMDEGNFDKVVLITNDFGSEKFSKKDEAELVVVDSNKPVKELIEDIKSALSSKISDTEVALNLVSGSGKEHMAILSALLKLGLGIRLTALTKEGVSEL